MRLTTSHKIATELFLGAREGKRGRGSIRAYNAAIENKKEELALKSHAIVELIKGRCGKSLVFWLRAALAFLLSG
jgi:hypothetical protein